MFNFVIETHDLTRRYGPQVSVKAVNMRVKRGEVYGFLGPNGAGKTTTIRMLLGLIRPTSGDVSVFGQPLGKHRIDILRRIGSLVESPSYYGHLTGYENLAIFARLLNVPGIRIQDVLEVVRLTSAAGKKVKGYSLGMKQRLGIAIALLGEPDLLILDEPTNGLDPAGIQEIRELIVNLPRRRGMTVLVSSHLLGEIDQMATQVGIIDGGRLVFEDDIEVLRQQSIPKLEIEVDDPERAANLLRSNHITSSLSENVLSLSDVAHAHTAEVNRQLVQAGISVFRIREVRPSLEDVFLSLVGTGRSL